MQENAAADTSAALIGAARDLASALRSIADAVRGPGVPPPVRPARGPVDLVGRRELARPLSGFLMGVPGLAAQFERRVPHEYLSRRGGDSWQEVRCVCEAVTVLRPFVPCSGGCGRYFLPAGLEVHVAGPYPPDDGESVPLRCNMPGSVAA